MHLSSEEKPTLAVVISLCSGTLFLFFALLFRIQQPWTWLMAASVLMIFASFAMYASPRHQTAFGALVVAFSLVSFLGFESAAPWNHIIISHNGESVYYQQDLSTHVATGIFLLIPGIGGGIAALSYRFLNRRRAKATPEGFMKQCRNCGQNIPVAAEECQYCKTKQP